MHSMMASWHDAYIMHDIDVHHIYIDDVHGSCIDIMTIWAEDRRRP